MGSSFQDQPGNRQPMTMLLRKCMPRRSCFLLIVLPPLVQREIQTWKAATAQTWARPL